MILGYPEGFRDTPDIYEAEVLYMTPKKKKLKKKQWIGLVFIAPWLIGLIGLQVYPFVASLFYSFTEYNIMSSPKWIGLANYVKLFKSYFDLHNIYCTRKINSGSDRSTGYE